MSTSSNSKALVPASKKSSKAKTKVNIGQVFVLIEGMLPFEACLYHQVVPLSIKGSTLHLGMVDPEDDAAADYVKRLVSYINCSIVRHPVSSDWHREVLSKFLSHSSKNQSTSQADEPKSEASKSKDKVENANGFSEGPTLVVGAPTEIHEKPQAVAKQKTKPAAISALSKKQQRSRKISAPSLQDPLNSKKSAPAQPAISTRQSVQAPAPKATTRNLKRSKSVDTAESGFSEGPTLVVEAPTEIREKPNAVSSNHEGQSKAVAGHALLQKKEQSSNGASTPSTRQPLSIDFASAPEKPLASPPEKSVDATQQSVKVSNAGTLNLGRLEPKEVTQSLLRRLIAQEGIGRLYLKRQSNTCQILLSKDGAMQSVNDKVSPQLFQGVINELKRMMSLALIPVRKPKQIEIERVYNQRRILFRLRLVPGDHGEEATLQILRGAALKFYQQQQIDNMSRDALGVANDLQQRISKLRTQAQRNLNLQQDTKQKTLPAIMSMLKQIEQEITDIIEDPE